ncbi:MAG: hypothetical protein M1835_000549 [Candelina submexicana]|nr:MAG: hypothetical protein M1835_000549 [Candelina submexicana]
MVVLLDLDGEGLDPLDTHIDPRNGFADPRVHLFRQVGGLKENSEDGKSGETEAERENPNINGFSASLGCYPVVTQLAQSLDLNTLHALSITCRQFRANLLPFRRQLVTQTLRCANEPARDFEHSKVKSSEEPWRKLSDEHVEKGRLTSGKVGRCARDMVGECRKCGKVVCRNCTIKTPSSFHLRDRHRRLCPTCLDAPLALHTSSTPPPPAPHSFTTPAFSRDPCNCTTSTWLCQPCGLSLRSSDVSYKRVWTWRTRYSTYFGGLSTGIGEGNEGVKCGRGASCLSAKDIEVEIDCNDVEEAEAAEPEKPEKPEIAEERHPGGGYLRQEIEGVGGRVKMKVRKRIRVGATVEEFEDEREKGMFLEREREGGERSWCGWCERVIVGGGDA